MHRSLWPREHGAYAQLGVPLVVALVVRTPTMATLALALAACLAFLANEPLLVVLGHRGSRMRASDGARAARRLASMAIAAAGLATAGLLVAPPSTLGVAGLAAVPALGVVGFAWFRREHSLAGELLAAVALPGAAAVTVVASGLAWQHALAIWAAWAVGYAASVVAVHRVLGQRRHHDPASALRLAVALAVIAVAAVAGVTRAPAVASVAAPLVAISMLLILRPPRPTRLRAIGVALVLASVVSASIAIVVVSTA